MTKITYKDVEGLTPWKSANLNDHMRRIPAFTLEEAIVGYTYESELIKPVAVAKKDMTATALEWLDNPFAPGVYFITAQHDDARPSLFAAYLMRRARYIQMMEGKHTSYRQYPKWYTAVNSWSSDVSKMLVDDNPSLAILGNLDRDSTAQKVDRVRDFIEVARMPIYIVASGVNPHSLMYDVLRRQPDDGVHLGYPEIEKQAII